jgi:hypothetical protein
VAALAAAWLATSAAGQELERADPMLRFLIMNRELAEAATDVPPRLAPDRVAAALPGPLAPALDRSDGIVRVRTLVRLGPGGEAALGRAGALIGARAGDIVTARIPIDALTSLLADPSVQAMEAATALRPLTLSPARPAGSDPTAAGTAPRPSAGVVLNDSANFDTGFDELRRRAGERWEGLAGQGVIVGVYDSGLDLTHEDFLRPDGGTRVLFAWDQTGDGAGPGPIGGQLFDYGVECTAEGIDGESCPMVDRIGHGTHVTGTAAGDGSATGQGQDAWRFPGGAPAADLVVVKGGDALYTSDRLVDGVAYMFARAEALGRPAVVNISLSSQFGPHDGTTLLEQALDALSGPGRIIVTGSGNAGDHRNTVPIAPNGPYHAQGSQGAGDHAVRIRDYTPAPGAVNDVLLVELWYDGADSLAITVRTPRGDEVTVATGDSATLSTPGGTVTLMNAVDGASPLNGDHGALIGILDEDEGLPPDTGRWAIEVAPVAINAGGDYHLWLTGAVFDAAILPGLDGGTNNRYLVGVPATADRVLSAGAHVTRHWWLGLGETPSAFPFKEPLGAIAYFSSPGPRRDGVLKPDLTAPGKVLMSSLSSDATLWDGRDWLIEADSVHVGLLGTSMAAPQLAAAVAVLLQLEPELTPEEARDLLRLSARADAAIPGDLPHPIWGAGKLDAAGAARRLRPQGLAGSGEAVSLSSNPIRGDVVVISYAEPPRSMAVYTVIAERVRSFTDAEIGPLTTVWPLDTDAGGEVANGVYVLVVELEGERVVRKLMVARP